jgi:YVTN family beta-propeller protein
VRFVLYFNGPAKTPVDITLELLSVEAVREDGQQFPVLTHPVSISSLEVVARQLLLAESFLPQGRYKKLRLVIPKARLRRGGKGIDLAVPPEGFLMPVNFEIKSGEATPLFMTWNVERAIEQEAFLRPAFRFAGRGKELRGVIAYVSNEESNTLSVIDRSTDRVVDVVGVGNRPKGIVVSPDTSRAFVVNSHSHTLTVLDVKNNRVLHTVNLEIGGRPSDLVITPDGETLYVTNTFLNTVSAIDSVSFQTLETIPVGRRPVALALDSKGARLLVANHGSNTVSVIDTRNNRVTTTISVEFKPAWIAINPTAAQAFVVHLRSPLLSIISLSTLRVTRTTNIGTAAAVLPDGITGRVFAAIVRRNRLALFDINLNTELDSVAVGEDPHRMALDANRGKLYVVNRSSDSVTVIDRNTRRVRATIPVGKLPYAIAIVR